MSVPRVFGRSEAGAKIKRRLGRRQRGDEMTKLKWIEGHPKDAGIAGWVWVTDENGNYAVVSIDMDEFNKPRDIGAIVAWAGPIEEPDESTLP